MTKTDCICDGATYYTPEQNAARRPFLVNPACPVHGPRTAKVYKPEGYTEADQRSDRSFLVGVAYGRESERERIAQDLQGVDPGLARAVREGGSR